MIIIIDINFMEQLYFKNSKQREIIKQTIKNRKDHPTALAIFEDIRKIDKNISLATVYRNLNLLANNGELKRVSVGDTDHFDPCTKTHHHFICENCGEIYDIDATKDFEKLEHNFENKFNGKIKSIDLKITGVCENCLHNINNIKKTSIL